MKSRYPLLAILVMLFLLGCSSEQEKVPKKLPASATIALPDFSSIDTENVFVYNCGDSLRFTAHVTSDSTWLFLSDTALKVLPVPSGSGARYEGSSYLYWSKGAKAILQKPRGSFMTCAIVKKEKSWQAARLRGIRFRALGQEPGWLLEIIPDQKLTFVSDYGQDTLTTQQYQLKTDNSGRIYTATVDGRSLKVTVSNAQCTDVMSGFTFPRTVSVTLAENTYTGCGQSLSDIRQ